LTALRSRDFDGLIAVLDPDLVVRVDEAAARPGAPREVHGAQTWARSAMAFAQTIRFAETAAALVYGTAGLLWVPRGHLRRVLSFTIESRKITKIDIIGDPVRLRELDLAILSD
jgi:hypothetical protein